MIVENEPPVIGRRLDSVRPFIDRWPSIDFFIDADEQLSIPARFERGLLAGDGYTLALALAAQHVSPGTALPRQRAAGEEPRRASAPSRA